MKKITTFLLVSAIWFPGYPKERVKAWLPPVGWEHSDHKLYNNGKLTTYAKKYIGRRTASGARFAGDMTAATNREYIYGHRVRIWHGGKSVEVLINDKFNRKKFALPFIKFDLSAKAMCALGLRDMAWADSMEVMR